jgi:hypothetical protein
MTPHFEDFHPNVAQAVEENFAAPLTRTDSAMRKKRRRHRAKKSKSKEAVLMAQEANHLVVRLEEIRSTLSELSPDKINKNYVAVGDELQEAAREASLIMKRLAIIKERLETFCLTRNVTTSLTKASRDTSEKVDAADVANSDNDQDIAIDLVVVDYRPPYAIANREGASTMEEQAHPITPDGALAFHAQDDSRAIVPPTVTNSDDIIQIVEVDDSEMETLPEIPPKQLFSPTQNDYDLSILVGDEIPLPENHCLVDQEDDINRHSDDTMSISEMEAFTLLATISVVEDKPEERIGVGKDLPDGRNASVSVQHVSFQEDIRLLRSYAENFPRLTSRKNNVKDTIGSILNVLVARLNCCDNVEESALGSFSSTQVNVSIEDDATDIVESSSYFESNESTTSYRTIFSVPLESAACDNTDRVASSTILEASTVAAVFQPEVDATTATTSEMVLLDTTNNLEASATGKANSGDIVWRCPDGKELSCLLAQLVMSVRLFSLIDISLDEVVLLHSVKNSSADEWVRNSEAAASENPVYLEVWQSAAEEVFVEKEAAASDSATFSKPNDCPTHEAAVQQTVSSDSVGHDESKEQDSIDRQEDRHISQRDPCGTCGIEDKILVSTPTAEKCQNTTEEGFFAVLKNEKPAIEKGAPRDSPVYMEPNHEPENAETPSKNTNCNNLADHEGVKKNAFEALLDSLGVDKFCGIDDATLANTIEDDMKEASRRTSIFSTLREDSVVDPFQNIAPTIFGKPLVHSGVKDDSKDQRPRKAKCESDRLTVDADATRTDANGSIAHAASPSEAVAAEGREDEFVSTMASTSPTCIEDDNVTASQRAETLDASRTTCERDMPGKGSERDEVHEIIAIDTSKKLSERVISAEQSVLPQDKFGAYYESERRQHILQLTSD